MFLYRDRSVDDQIGGPGLSRMDAEALAALDTGGIRGSTGGSESAGLIQPGNRVSMDVAARGILAAGGTAEAGNRDGLCWLFCLCGSTGRGSHRDPDTFLGLDPDAGREIRGLEDQEGRTVATEGSLRSGIDVPAGGVQPGHQTDPLSVAEARHVEGVGRYFLQIDRESLLFEVIHAQTGLGNVPVSGGMLDHGGRRHRCRGGFLHEGGPVHVGAEEGGEEAGGLC